MKSLLLNNLKNSDEINLDEINLDLGRLPCLSSLNEINVKGTLIGNVASLAAAGKNLERVAGIDFTDTDLQTLLHTAPQLKYLSGQFSQAQIELISQHARLKQIEMNGVLEETPILPDLEEFSSGIITFGAFCHLVKTHPRLKSFSGQIRFLKPMQESDFEFLKRSSIRFFTACFMLHKPEDINNSLYFSRALPHIADFSLSIRKHIVAEQLFRKKQNILPDHQFKHIHIHLQFVSSINAPYSINLHPFQKAETLDFVFLTNIVVFDTTDMPSLPYLKIIKINTLAPLTLENLEPFLFECIAKAPHLEEIVIELRESPNTQQPFSSPEACARLTQLVAARKLSVNIKINAAQDLPRTPSSTDLRQAKDFFKTESDNPMLKAKRYFPGREPNLYRLWIWQPDLNSLCQLAFRIDPYWHSKLTPLF